MVCSVFINENVDLVAPSADLALSRSYTLERRGALCFFFLLLCWKHKDTQSFNPSDWKLISSSLHLRMIHPLCCLICAIYFSLSSCWRKASNQSLTFYFFVCSYFCVIIFYMTNWAWKPFRSPQIWIKKAKLHSKKLHSNGRFDSFLLCLCVFLGVLWCCCVPLLLFVLQLQSKVRLVIIIRTHQHRSCGEQLWWAFIVKGQCGKNKINKIFNVFFVYF